MLTVVHDEDSSNEDAGAGRSLLERSSATVLGRYWRQR